MQRSEDLKEQLALDGGVGTDPLQFILDRQLRLHRRVADDPELGWAHLADAFRWKYAAATRSDRPTIRRDVPVDQDTLLTIDNAVMLMMEAAEIVDWLPWKKHKRDFGRALTAEEREKALEEVIDCLHFVVNLLHLLGVSTSQEVAQRYLAKNNVNHARQDGGY